MYSAKGVIERQPPLYFNGWVGDGERVIIKYLLFAAMTGIVKNMIVNVFIEVLAGRVEY